MDALVVEVNVEGAPFRPGQPVLIRHAAEDMDPRFAGSRGVVTALVYDEPLQQFPRDPLLRVHVEGLGDDLFLPKELSPAASGTVARPRARRG